MSRRTQLSQLEEVIGAPEAAAGRKVLICLALSINSLLKWFLDHIAE